MQGKKYSIEDYKNWPYVEEPVRFEESNNKPSTQALFYETLKPEIVEKYGYRYTRFSLREREVNGFPSAYQIIHYAKSEYDAAMKITGDLEIWKKIKKSDILSKGVANVHVGISQALEAQEKRIEGEMESMLLDQASKGNVSAMKELRALKAKGTKRGRKPLPKKDNVSSLEKTWKQIKNNG